MSLTNVDRIVVSSNNKTISHPNKHYLEHRNSHTRAFCMIAMTSEKSFPFLISRRAMEILRKERSNAVSRKRNVTRFPRYSRKMSTINYPRVQISQIITHSDTLTLHLYGVPVFGINQLDLGLVGIRMFERGVRRSGINSPRGARERTRRCIQSVL